MSKVKQTRAQKVLMLISAFLIGMAVGLAFYVPGTSAVLVIGGAIAGLCSLGTRTP